MNSINFYSWVLLFFAAINSAIGNILIKKSRSDVSQLAIIDNFFNPWFLAGIIFYIINLILFAKALDNLPVSLAYPVLASLGFIFLSFAANYFLKEQFSLMQYFGMTFIICGIFMMNYKLPQ